MSTERGDRTPNRLAVGLGLVLFVTMTACGGGSGGDTPYAPPETVAGEDGWMTYVGAPMIDRGSAAGLDPAPTSPEGAVVKFLASHVRADDAWRDAATASPSGRAERALDEWQQWQLERFQLRGRKDLGADSAYVRVFFDISIDGRSDGGEDEFEVAREAGGWRVTQPPT